MADGFWVIAQYDTPKAVWPLGFWVYHHMGEGYKYTCHTWRYGNLGSILIRNHLERAVKCNEAEVSRYLAKLRISDMAVRNPCNYEVLTVEDALAVVAAWKLSQAMSQ